MVLAGLGGAVGLAALLSRPSFRLVEATGAIAAGNFNIALPVASRDELGVLTDSFNRMARSLREKEMVKRALPGYVAREVVEEILTNPENMALTGERREVTVLFCDVRGFTPLSERLSPEEVVLLLNDFYNLMIETTFKHDGTLDKFLGDAVMAVFGAPLAHPDHSARAIRTPLAMQEGVVGLNERGARDGKEPIAGGIGVSPGEPAGGGGGGRGRGAGAPAGPTPAPGAASPPARPGPRPAAYESEDFVVTFAQPGEAPATLAARYLGSADRAWMIEDYSGQQAFSPGQEIVIPRRPWNPPAVTPGGCQTVTNLTYHI